MEINRIQERARQSVTICAYYLRETASYTESLNKRNNLSFLFIAIMLKKSLTNDKLLFGWYSKETVPKRNCNLWRKKRVSPQNIVCVKTQRK